MNQKNETVSNYILRMYQEVDKNLTKSKESKPEWEDLANEMMRWLPDLFLITSLLFKKTGIYIHIMYPPNGERFPEDEDWQDKIQDVSNEWYRWIWRKSDEYSKYKNLEKCINELKECLQYDITLTDLHSFSSSLQNNHDQDSKVDQLSIECWNWCKLLFKLHALADEVCAGFGTPSGDYWIKDSKLNPSERKIVHFSANSLLTYTGSLSRFPAHIGIVLPKMRTPGVGMTVRSISHHLTFHQTEVKVDWRTLPWINIDENTVNILIVPYPYKVNATDFQPSPSVTNRANREDGRYFHYSGGQQRYNNNILLKMLDEIEESVNRVHLIVFPEQALTENERDEILFELTARYDNRSDKNRTQLPMVMAGIRPENQREYSADAKDFELNKVVLSTFFAGKWYQTEQPKHHRWKLDRYQIRQYNLGGVLAGSRDWWEAIPYTQRKVSILAPNGWLALCPLICEDLARQEPVAEVIRGIGPTIIIAILLDGPQIPARWSARYASVLADDPGSSVLTVSSLGMTLRSKKDKSVSEEDTGSREVALWRDAREGFEQLEIAEGKAGILLNTSAKWIPELTADGRVDNKSSAMFMVDGKFQTGQENLICDDVFTKDTVDHSQKVKEHILSQNTDLLEISLISYFVDAAFECIVPFSNKENIGYLKELQKWILSIDGSIIENEIRPNKLQSIFELLSNKNKELYANGNGNEHSEVKPYLDWFVAWMEEISVNIHNNDNYDSLLKEIRTILTFIRTNKFKYFELLKGEDVKAPIPARKQLTGSFGDEWFRSARIPVYMSLALLWAIYKRLYNRLRDGKLDTNTANIFKQVEDLLKKNHDSVWFDAIVDYHKEE